MKKVAIYMARLNVWTAVLTSMIAGAFLAWVIGDAPEGLSKTWLWAMGGLGSGISGFTFARLKYGWRPRVLTKPPGYRLGRILSFVLTKKTYENLVVQVILDERDEHAEALAEGQKWKARFITCRLWVLVLVSLMAAACASTISKLFPRAPTL